MFAPTPSRGLRRVARVIIIIAVSIAVPHVANSADDAQFYNAFREASAKMVDASLNAWYECYPDMERPTDAKQCKDAVRTQVQAIETAHRTLAGLTPPASVAVPVRDYLRGLGTLLGRLRQLEKVVGTPSASDAKSRVLAVELQLASPENALRHAADEYDESHPDPISRVADSGWFFVVPIGAGILAVVAATIGLFQGVSGSSRPESAMPSRTEEPDGEGKVKAADPWVLATHVVNDVHRLIDLLESRGNRKLTGPITVAVISGIFSIVSAAITLLGRD